MRGFIPERNHANVKCVGKPSDKVQLSFNIRECILERDLTNVMCVGRLLAMAPP
jgi:hypothetical protein